MKEKLTTLAEVFSKLLSFIIVFIAHIALLFALVNNPTLILKLAAMILIVYSLIQVVIGGQNGR